jgi:hypothetical protein
MDSRFPAHAEQQAPRYTSYPTAPHFSALGNLSPLGGDEALSPMFADWMAPLVNDRFFIKPGAQTFCRLVAAFDAHAQRGVARHSRAV